ncbi:glycine zipper 2TM domain-containing protein [Sphingobium sp. AN558]|uniref:glycine zipper 2TM domain-containing protein n=1 Tax=Sphingobium sp. AN558 TaxID=3133442 RepID=UPI0030C25FF6
MRFPIKGAITALSLGAMTLGGLAATPAFAQPGQNWQDRADRREDRQDRRDDRRDDRNDRRAERRDERRDNRWADRRDDRRDDRRHDRRGDRDNFRRPGAIVYRYDHNRPDPRYGRYYRPDRYYRSGYAPIRVDRSTRIYRGYDDRYYCRRSDGTTGLIVGAALGGLLGSQLDRGRSNTAGILIGGGAGALLGREVDRGSLNCR